MKARIAKPTNDLTEEKVQKFIDEGRDLAWFMAEYGLSVDSLGRLFYKRFGDILGTKFYNQLAANGFKKDEENMLRELAEKYGVSADTVRRWVRLARKEMRDNV